MPDLWSISQLDILLTEDNFLACRHTESYPQFALVAMFLSNLESSSDIVRSMEHPYNPERRRIRFCMSTVSTFR